MSDPRTKSVRVQDVVVPITKIVVLPRESHILKQGGAYIQIAGRWYRLEEVSPEEIPE